MPSIRAQKCFAENIAPPKSVIVLRNNVAIHSDSCGSCENVFVRLIEVALCS